LGLNLYEALSLTESTFLLRIASGVFFLCEIFVLRKTQHQVCLVTSRDRLKIILRWPIALLN